MISGALGTQNKIHFASSSRVDTTSVLQVVSAARGTHVPVAQGESALSR
jgi:hypothetical protein